MKLARTKFKNGHQYWFYCTGCGHAHSYTVGCDIPGQNWTFDQLTITFTPSLRIYIPATTHTCDGCKNNAGCELCKMGKIERPETTVCHLFIRNGNVKYCGDCQHGLKGQTLTLADFPEYYDLADGDYEIVV